MNIIYSILKPVIALFDKSQTVVSGQSFQNINTVPILLSNEPIQHLIATNIVTSDTETNIPFLNIETGVNKIDMIEKHSVASLIGTSMRFNISVYNTPIAILGYESYDYGITWLLVSNNTFSAVGINSINVYNFSNLIKITIKNSTAGTGLTNTLSIYTTI